MVVAAALNGRTIYTIYIYVYVCACMCKYVCVFYVCLYVCVEIVQIAINKQPDRLNHRMNPGWDEGE